MASSKPIQCEPCYTEKINTEADIWCNNCDAGLCSTCLSYHKRSYDHNTIDIKRYKNTTRAIRTECDKHGQQLNLYCLSHLMPCCDECIVTSHSNCTGVTSLAIVVDKTKIEKSKESIETDIKSILTLSEKLVTNKINNIKTGENQCVSMKEAINEIRSGINKHLDHLEEQFCIETDKTWNQEKSKATDFISEIEGTIELLNKMKEDLQSVTECIIPTKLQSFLFVHQIEQNVHQCQQYIEDMEHDTRAKEVYIKMKKYYEIEKVIGNLRSFNSFGEVMVVTSEVTNRETRMIREAQVESRKQPNINVIMNIKTKIEINMEKSISDMICLMDGRVIVVELQGNVNLLTFDGKLQKRLSIHGVAWCVTQINQNTIAITNPHEKAIKIFNLEKEKVTKTISILKLCYGLSFSDNSLAVGLYKDEIRIIDLKGKQLKSIQVESKSNLYNLVYCNDRVSYTDYMGKAVRCYEGSGKQIWQYKQDLSGPWGLCTDIHGNIIVADFESSRIIIISKDGQNSKVMMSEEDRLTDLKCICFNHKEYSGFICDDNGRYLTNFNLLQG